MSSDQARAWKEAMAECGAEETNASKYDRKRAEVAPMEELIADVCARKEPFQYLEDHEVAYLVLQLNKLTNDLLENPLDAELCKRIAEDVRRSVGRVGDENWPCVIDYLEVLMTNIRATVKSLQE